MLDIDYFKKVNDQFGHDAGDLVLQVFAQHLTEQVRATDIVCRYGGEEFLIVLPKAFLNEAFQIAERFGTKILIEKNRELYITVSFLELRVFPYMVKPLQK